MENSFPARARICKKVFLIIFTPPENSFLISYNLLYLQFYCCYLNLSAYYLKFSCLDGVHFCTYYQYSVNSMVISNDIQ